MLRSVGWFRTDVSGLRIDLIIKGKDVLLDIFTVEDGTHMYSQNVGAKPTYAV
jgi:hypothetical protein